MALLLTGVSAQKQRRDLGPRSFFPSEYTSEYFIDLDALQDTDFWDCVERFRYSGMLFIQFRKEFGFRMQEIRTVRAGAKYLRDPNASEDKGREALVCVMEGSNKLCLPSVEAREGYHYLVRQADRVAGFDVVTEGPAESIEAAYAPQTFVIPRPGCLAFGDGEMIRSVLTGQRRGGVISSELMPLTAHPRPLAYLAMSVPSPDSPFYEQAVPFLTTWLTEQDPLQHFTVRLARGETAETFKIVLTMRFLTGKQGPDVLEESMQASLKAQKSMPFYKMTKSLLDQIVWKRDGTDLLGVLDLGGRREIARLLGAYGGGLPLLLYSAHDAVQAMAAAPGALVPVVEAVNEDLIEEQDEAVKPKPKPKAVKPKKK